MRSKTIIPASTLLISALFAQATWAAMPTETQSDDMNPIVISIAPAVEQDLMVLPTKVSITTLTDSFFIDDQLTDKTGVNTLVSLHGDIPIEFSQPVEIQIPVTIAENSSVKIISSDDLVHWTTIGEVSVTGGNVIFETSRLNFVAVYKNQTEIDSAPNLADITGHWAETSILQLARLGIVEGKLGNLFAPNDAITRAEFTKMIVLAFHPAIEQITTTSYEDVLMGDWFAPYVETLLRDGVVDDTTMFNPNVPITRAEAVKILILASGNNAENLDIDTFSDVLPTDWFSPYVTFMKARNLIVGYPDGTFRPAQAMTRAEAAQILMTFVNGFSE
jgi:hypothetical protein